LAKGRDVMEELLPGRTADTAGPGAARVTGVRTADGAALAADLVVDAGGRGW
jgi:hypothetical protein